MENVTVLIVDKSAAVRDGLRSILSAFPDIELVGEAVDGADAIDKAEILSPSVVLVDAQLPEMDGLEATRRLKARFPEIAVLFLTVHADYLDQALAAGADDYLPKDSGRQLLVEKIRELGAARRSAEES